jgi:precorrin-2/cobalt-factor-2 C20-methyltransferase
MKISKNLPQLKKILKSKGLLDKAVLVSKCGLEDEEIEFDIESVDSENVSYFSTMIIKKGGVQ